VTEFRRGGKDYLWVKVFDGTQSTPDPGMVADFGGHPDRPWTGDMVGRGLVWARVTARYNRELFTGGVAFDMRFEMAGHPLYDPREDGSAGGSGPQRWNDPATWAPSENPVVAAYNILRGLRYQGETVWGPGFEAWRLPLGSWFAAMNACDAAVAVEGGGTEPAYRFGAEIDLSSEPREVLDELMKCCAGDIAEVAGQFLVRVGQPAPPVRAFTDRDVVVTEPSELDPFPGVEETFNGVTATYPDPAAGWEMVEAPPRFDEEARARDGGRRQAASLQYPYVGHARQVQRLMLALLRDQRRFRTHVLTLPPECADVAPLDTVSWTSARNGYTAKWFEVRKRALQPNGNVTLVLREVDPADYDWSSDDELPVAAEWLGSTPPAPPAMIGWAVAPEAIFDGAGNARRPAIRIFWATEDVDGMRGVLWQVRLGPPATGQPVVTSGQTEDFEAGSLLIASPALLPATTYEVRGWYLAADNRQTQPSEWLAVTTPNIRLGPPDIAPGSITADLLDPSTTEGMIEGRRFLLRTAEIFGGRRIVTGFGFGLEDAIQEGGAPVSLFEILADTFRVVAPPGVPGRPAKAVFQVGQVDGKAEVVVAGTLYADQVIATRVLAENAVTDTFIAEASILTIATSGGIVRVNAPISAERKTADSQPQAVAGARIEVRSGTSGAWTTVAEDVGTAQAIYDSAFEVNRHFTARARVEGATFDASGWGIWQVRRMRASNAGSTPSYAADTGLIVTQEFKR
jgi:hypothetical protein